MRDPSAASRPGQARPARRASAATASGASPAPRRVSRRLRPPRTLPPAAAARRQVAGASVAQTPCRGPPFSQAPPPRGRGVCLPERAQPVWQRQCGRVRPGARLRPRDGGVSHARDRSGSVSGRMLRGNRGGPAAPPSWWGVPYGRRAYSALSRGAARGPRRLPFTHVGTCPRPRAAGRASHRDARSAGAPRTCGGGTTLPHHAEPFDHRAWWREPASASRDVPNRTCIGRMAASAPRAGRPPRSVL